MWLGRIPWAGRHWALPVLTALAPSERYYQRRGRSHKKLTDRARQMILQLRRWLPHRSLVLLGDSGYAVLDLLHFCQSLRQPVTFITGYLYNPVAAGCRSLCSGAAAPAGPEGPSPGERRTPAHPEKAAQPAHRVLDHHPGGLVRQHDAPGGTHLPNGGLVSHRQTARPFAGSWSETRMGNSNPKRCSVPARQWLRRTSWNGLCCAGNWKSPSRRYALIWEWKPSASGPAGPSPAPRRYWPVLMGLFSWTALTAHLLQKQRPMLQRTAAWYAKPAPTFVDAIALVRRHLWLASEGFSTSPPEPDIQKLPLNLFHRLIDSLAYAA